MSRNKHRHSRAQPARPTTPVTKALEHVPGDLADLTDLWPRALEQLDLRVDPAPRVLELTPDFIAAREERDRAERAERILNSRDGIEPLGASPSPVQIAALDDLVIAQVGLLDLGDQLTTHVRGNGIDRRVGPHRLNRQRLQPATTTNPTDHLGYPLRLGYGMRVFAGHDIDLVGGRRDADPTLSAIAWIRAALPAITLLAVAEHTANEVRRIRGRVRSVIGLPDMQVRLSPSCFVCEQPSLRMNVDKLYVECRNPNCEPSPMQCTYTGPRGEPRWYRAEWRTLSKRLGVDVEDHLLQLLEQHQAS